MNSYSLKRKKIKIETSPYQLNHIALSQVSYQKISTKTVSSKAGSNSKKLAFSLDTENWKTKLLSKSNSIVKVLIIT